MCPAPSTLLRGFALCPPLWIWTGFFSSPSPRYLGSCCFALSRSADLSFPQLVCSSCTSGSPSPWGTLWPQGSPRSPSVLGALGTGQAAFITLASGWGATWTPPPLLWHLGCEGPSLPLTLGPPSQAPTGTELSQDRGEQRSLPLVKPLRWSKQGGRQEQGG